MSRVLSPVTSGRGRMSPWGVSYLVHHHGLLLDHFLLLLGGVGLELVLLLRELLALGFGDRLGHEALVDLLLEGPDVLVELGAPAVHFLVDAVDLGLHYAAEVVGHVVFVENLVEVEVYDGAVYGARLRGFSVCGAGGCGGLSGEYDYSEGYHSEE